MFTLLVGCTFTTSDSDGGGIEFAISFSENAASETLDGRIILLLSSDNSSEPRFQTGPGAGAISVFGMDVDGLAPGAEAVIASSVFGYPIESLDDLPRGVYYVQAVFHKYETFHLSTGHTVKLPMDQGEGQHWNRSPGNLYSTPRRISIDPSRPVQYELIMSEVIPHIPEPIWDKYSGQIDHEVAEYWRENYDLRYILERDWATLGPKLVGKLHIFCGDMDNYYLNNAVYLMEEFLESTTAPYYAGEVDYGDRAEHCWNGDQENPNHISRLRYNTMYLPMILERIAESAPVGADLKSWWY